MNITKKKRAERVNSAIAQHTAELSGLALPQPEEMEKYRRTSLRLEEAFPPETFQTPPNPPLRPDELVL